MPSVADVETASWRHPYHFSGRLPLRGLALIVGVGVPAALIAGAVGYFGGAITGWIGTHAIQLGMAAGSWVADLHLLGNAASLVLGVIAGIVVGTVPVILIVFLYPGIFGGVAGGAVLWGAMAGKCRKPWVVGLLGFLAGGLTFAAWVGAGVLMNAPPNESARLMEVAAPWMGYGLLVIDGLMVVIVATVTARSVNRTRTAKRARSGTRPRRRRRSRSRALRRWSTCWPMDRPGHSRPCGSA